MKSDEQLKQDVVDELRWDPAIDAGDVDVSVHQGVVTMSGTVASCAQKLAAQKAVQRVAGGKALVIELGVRVPAPDASADVVQRTDSQPGCSSSRCAAARVSAGRHARYSRCAGTRRAVFVVCANGGPR